MQDLQSVKGAMHGVDCISHAAALKQVSSCELRDWEGYLAWYEKYDEVEKFAEENPRNYHAVASKKGKLAAALWKYSEIAVLRNLFTVTNGNIYPNRLAREHLEYRKAELKSYAENRRSES